MIRPLLALCFMLMLNPAFTASLTAEEEAATPSRRNLEIDDLFRFKSVGNPEVSPDGKWVAYTVRSTDLKEEKSETRIWLAPVGDGEKLPMTVEGSSASQPRFSPDGRYLSFLASRKGGGDEDDSKTQVWLLDRRGGEARQLTKVMQGVSSYEWSPDATRLVLLIKDPSPEELERQKHKEQGTRPRRTKTRPPYVVDRLQAKRDYAGYLDRRRTHLYVFDVAAKTSTQITSGDADDRSPVWSPDGRFLAFVSNRTEDQDANYDTNIWVVASDNPDMGKTLIQVTQNPGGDEQPAWSPDGKWIAYVSNPHPELLWYATNQLALIPAPSTGEAAEPRLLIEALDRNARGPAFAPDSSAVYFLLEDSGERHLARVAVKDGALTRPIDGPRTVGSFAVGETGLVAALISEPKLPSEVFLLEPGKRAAARGPRQLTTVNQKLLDELRPGDMEEVQFTSADGTPVEGFLVKPPAFSPELEYPGILLIHGGPVSQFSKSWSFQAQLFAANGYVVMMVNPRGSSGYGQEFSKAIFADWGNKDVQDVLAGVDYAVAQGYVDPDRLGVGGWSYGGMMTNYVISQTTRFKAAISGAGGALWTAHWGHDHYQREYIVELGLPWKNREAWERISSPFYNVEKITTPVLYMGGALDWNVPIIGSEHMYQSLRVLGRTTKLVVYPGEHHGIRKPSYQKDRYERNLAWYGQYVKGEPEKK